VAWHPATAPATVDDLDEMLDLFDHAARLRWQALDIEPTFRQLRAQISDTSSLELLLNPGCRVIVPDHLADSILLEQNGVFPNHLHGIERRHLPAQHVDDSAIAVLVSDSYGESIMATATWIDESLIDDAATRRQRDGQSSTGSIKLAPVRTGQQ